MCESNDTSLCPKYTKELETVRGIKVLDRPYHLLSGSFFNSVYRFPDTISLLDLNGRSYFTIHLLELLAEGDKYNPQSPSNCILYDVDCDSNITTSFWIIYKIVPLQLSTLRSFTIYIFGPLDFEASSCYSFHMPISEQVKSLIRNDDTYYCKRFKFSQIQPLDPWASLYPILDPLTFIHISRTHTFVDIFQETAGPVIFTSFCIQVCITI